jgi:hypothetical protein
VTALAFSPDGAWLASGHETGMVVLWDTARGVRQARLMGHGGGVHALAFNPAGNLLASASLDGTVRLWDVNARAASGEPLQNRQPGFSYDSLAFSRDGHALAGGDRGGGISLWQVESRERIARLDDHHDRVTGLVFTLDGKQLASAGWDGRINLWDLRQRRVVSGVEGLGSLNGLSLNATGEWLAAVGERLHFWRIFERGLEANLSQPAPEGLPLSAVSISPVADVIAVGAGDAVLLWNPLAIAREPGITPCQIAGRNPTLAEWPLIAPSSPDGRICTEYPVHPSFLRSALNSALQAAAEDDSTNLQLHLANAVTLAGQAPGLDRDVCWLGAKTGYAALVMPACEAAVLTAPDNARQREARGLARALTRDSAGAIADFSAVIAWAQETDYDGVATAQWVEWVNQLRAGQNPFSPGMLAALPSQP